MWKGRRFRKEHASTKEGREWKRREQLEPRDIDSTKCNQLFPFAFRCQSTLVFANFVHKGALQDARVQKMGQHLFWSLLRLAVVEPGCREEVITREDERGNECLDW